VRDLGVDDEEPLEWFWPPTAPVGYDGAPKPTDETIQRQHSPWTAPTRLTKTDHTWRLAYGEAIAQKPDPPQEYAESSHLLDDLRRIEWWPMTVQEAGKIQAERLMHTTRAAAYDLHSQGFTISTEPYETRMRELHDRMRSNKTAHLGDREARKWAGDLGARLSLIDAEAWASAVRTARAGGEGWSVSGPESRQ
ncbi:MAG TPA: hypothetical protein H9830_02310, partial [Candidatus Agrococcus pullicola]|nr:hypothetical protein [Candidatus Agrococcus pullicola]